MEEARSREHSLPMWRHSLLGFGYWVFLGLLRVTGIIKLGTRNALNIKLTEIDLSFEHLPEEFDGYRLLQISDPHFDTIAGIDDAICKIAKNVAADLCVITGDIQGRHVYQLDQPVASVERLLPHITAPDGIFAILGNHDSLRLIPALEKLGVTFLVNETVSLARGNSQIFITGLDDVHSYYTPAASGVLKDTPQGFKIALVHSPGIENEAEAAGYGLYLCGHTHGGQVALPGGHPLNLNLHDGAIRDVGAWKIGNMLGFTSRGAGVSILPVRFNAPAEITVLTLCRDR
ncbi:MAG: metallophosphoesterase [Rhodospirillaceae bacterium]|nr:metallophosphoesterase [Rhodospirillaceae bacterium]MBT3887168.1 metallophosphoesterase [Rhodospirillaceae bacterium]MBT4115524.1 metallophosphoesterase [Rhodospirillaceae bacterium]MBT4673525.1 metallophosphoesterase [Rhodospirillaceae bacterium]MBT4721702.1 metallophosphoesterase [Rhodospirillaceae bacterium]